MMAATLDAFGEQIAANAPLKRIGRPDDMAGAAIYLSSRAGAYLTGRDHPGRRRHRHHALGSPMGKVAVVENLTLDGVMQAPARPDEDRRGGFAHGGWATPYGDEVMASYMGERMAQGGALLLGRRTYLDFASVWPDRKDNPFTEVLENRQKYVASTTLTEPLPWRNSTLLDGDAAEKVAGLKQMDQDLGVLGSGELVRSLMRRNLVDEYLLSIYPIVLGSGRRLFADGAGFAALVLVDAVTTSTGVIIATYRPAEPTAGTGE